MDASNRNTPKLEDWELVELPVSFYELPDAGQAQEQQIICTICQEEYKPGDIVRTTKCLHMFHKACIDQWCGQVNGTCPTCKVV